MSPKDIYPRLADIRKYAEEGDYEAAHAAEDDLWRDVLRAITDQEVSHPEVIAAMALSTRRIHFERHCA